MTTKFSIGYETFDQLNNDRIWPPNGRYPITIETIEEKYKNYYKSDGWILDIENTDFYKVTDEFIDYLKIGDTVVVANNTLKVVYDKHYDFVKKVVVYYLMPKPEYLEFIKQKEKPENIKLHKIDKDNDIIKLLNTFKKNIEFRIETHEKELKRIDRNPQEDYFTQGQIKGLLEAISSIELGIILHS